MEKQFKQFVDEELSRPDLLEKLSQQTFSGIDLGYIRARLMYNTYFYLRYTKHDPSTWRTMEIIFNLKRNNISLIFKKYKAVL